MKQLDDAQLDLLIHRHVARELDSHVGQAVEAFGYQVGQVRRRRMMGWAIGVIGGAVAASLALAGAMHWIHSRPMQPPPGSLGTPVANVPPGKVEWDMAWKTFDEGTVVLDGDIPARRLRRTVLQRMQWYDPQKQALVEVAVPREQVIFVRMNTY